MLALLYTKVPFGITLVLHAAAEQIASNRNRYFWLGFMLTLTGIILYMLFGRKAMIISALGSMFLGLAAIV